MIEAIKTFVRKWWAYRSSRTGKFVTRDYAERNPDTTQRERRP